jgi:hypothetical protein
MIHARAEVEKNIRSVVENKTLVELRALWGTVEKGASRMPQILMILPEGKYKVLTMSYDDGTQADKKLVKIFNIYMITHLLNLYG